MLAQSLGVSGAELDRIKLAPELHDIGKVAIPDAILNKPGPLDEAEWEFIRRHTVIGERILTAAPSLAHTSEIARSQHERYDGTRRARRAGDHVGYEHHHGVRPPLPR